MNRELIFRAWESYLNDCLNDYLNDINNKVVINPSDGNVNNTYSSGNVDQNKELLELKQ